MEELLIWVDEEDHPVGYGEKLKTHELGKLHRAFSLFIYNRYDQKFLIHRRADGKYHSGGLWTNSCCSHPRKGESLRFAVRRRVSEELGLVLREDEYEGGADPRDGLKEAGKFQYYHDFGRYAESEIDHVFYLPIMREKVELSPDSGEISEVKWISVSELGEWLGRSPEEFTVWFPEAFAIASAMLAEREG